MGVSLAERAAVGAIHDPLEHAHILAEARPDELAIAVLAEPVHMEDARRLAETALHLDPVAEIIAHVVAAEGQHGHRVAAHFADRARRRGRHFRAHGRADVNAGAPVEGLIDQGHGRGAAPAEDDRADRHALGVLPCRDRWSGHCEAGAVKRALGWAALAPVSCGDLAASTFCPASRGIRRAARRSCPPTRLRPRASGPRW